MTLSEQVDSLQARFADLKTSLDASRKETSEQIKARIAAAKAKADDLDAKLKGGANFADLAKANSTGSTAAQGGDLGIWTRGKLAKQLEDATFVL